MTVSAHLPAHLPSHLPLSRTHSGIALKATLLSGISLLLAAVPLPGQYNSAPPPAAWALENVTVNHADGRTEEGMTLVVRGGVIEVLRAGAPVPADARDVSWADGTLHVYPGFVDAHGGVAVDLPTPSRDGVQSWNPTRAVQFFTPHREAAGFITAGGTALGAERRRGVVASVVFPGRGVLPGQPSLILHRVDGRTSGDLVVRPSLGLAAAWQGAQGAYPGTLMAQHAFLRQSFMDAEHYRAHRDAFARDPRGMAMGTRDADYEWLLRAAAGEVPVYFQASGAEDIRRVLRLSDELGFRPIIVGGSEAGEVAAELARRGVVVFLSADLPDPQQWTPGSDTISGASEPSPASSRERARLEPIYRTASDLARAGVPFALTSGGEAGVDLLKGARRAIEFGLDESLALRALTEIPAGMVGAESAVSLGEGMAATFIVTDRPLFHEETGIAWTFVNGHAEKGRDPAEARPEGDPDAADPGAAEPGAVAPGAVAGIWTGAISGGPQSWPLALHFEESATGLRGFARSDAGPDADLSDVTLEGDRIRFGLRIPQAQGALASLEGTLDGDRMTGTGTLQFGDTSFPFTFEFRRTPGGALR
ncbi:hypothetical protein BH23GEM11_BH23GEM11_00240 [soil metagenome]